MIVEKDGSYLAEFKSSDTPISEAEASKYRVGKCDGSLEDEFSGPLKKLRMTQHDSVIQAGGGDTRGGE